MIQGIVGQGSDPSLKYTVSPTGGVILLQPQSAADFGTWTLTRFFSVSGTAVSGVTLVQGVTGQSPTQVFVDLGDGANAPLDSSSLYAYAFTTSAGTVQTPALSPGCTIVLEPDEISSILYRSLQSAIASLKLPAGFRNGPQVIHAMPLAGQGVPILPTIAFNETFLQQQDQQIGQNVDPDFKVNSFQIASQALRHYTVFVMAANVREREYYKDAVIAIFNSILGPILERIGNNIHHRWQVSSSQMSGRSNEPGYYFSEILLEFTGLYSVGITTTYGVVHEIVLDANDGEVTVLLS